MAAVALLGTVTFNTTSGTKTVTATPGIDDLIVIVTAHTGNTSTTAPSDDQGGTYTLISSAVKATSADTMAVFIRDALVTDAISTIFTHAPGTSTGGGLAVFRVSGMVRTGSSASRQTAKQDNQAAATPAPVFASSPLTGNSVIGAVFNATNPAGMTPRTNFTERSDSGYSTPTAGLETMSRDSGETATTQTWGSASASAFCSLVIELDTSALGTTYNDTRSESLTAADSSSSAHTMPNTRSEALTAGDAATSAQTMSSSRSEALTAADAATSAQTMPESRAEALTAADAFIGGLLLSSSLSEPLTAAHAQTAALTFNLPISEGLTASHTQSAVQLFSSTLSEGLTSAFAMQLGYFETLSEALTASVAMVSVATFNASLSDSLVAEFIAEGRRTWETIGPGGSPWVTTSPPTSAWANQYPGGSLWQPRSSDNSIWTPTPTPGTGEWE